MSWQPIQYEYDSKGNIVLPSGPPFDGEPVLIKTNTGVVEAWWEEGRRTETMDGPEYDGWQWICYDDKFQCDLDDALFWMPLP